jgi:hypothetical protein
MKQKDKTIKAIVRHLQDNLGVDNIVIKDYWDADNFAIGLTNKEDKNLVYISTWQKKNNEYFVELESPAENEEYKNCGDFDNISVEKVEEIVRTHLSLK